MTPRGLGAGGLTATGLSLGCFLLTALLGPSVMEPALPGSITGGQPPYALDADPSPYLVIGLVAAGVLLGTLGIGLCLYAARRGWRCSPKPLMVAGLLVTAAFVLMPPIGSGDHLNYAAYGRMAVTGHDPYATRAVDLPGDPIADATQEWRRAPSVYGPIVTAQEAFASWIGGDSVRLTVFVLSVTNALAFVLAGWLLYRVCKDKTRAVLLWTLNPLMLFHLVAGAHNDALGIAAAVGALAVFMGASRPVLRALASGALVGAGAAIKFPAALVGGGPAWVLLRDWRAQWRRLVALVGGAVVVVVISYGLAGAHAFDQVRRAANSVSLASPWHLLDAAMGVNQHRVVIRIGTLVLLVALIWLLARALPPVPAKGADETVRIAAALVLAWLFAASYALPWYDGLGWAVLVLLPWSRFDWVLLAHTAGLSLAYLPARDPRLIGLPDNLSWLVTTVRPVVIPWLLTGVLAWLVVTALRPPRPGPAPAPVRSPRASAGSPG